ncbi:hypothetical protein [Filimonas effusa]|uniref:Uncharacterized protein n=1 Tax=Filimonas effusa TaxID=2508721 RepID=A0A4Q1DD02_9BACT|nr:hypothetical protein [Filimonas effusa]RXK86745.1 hypothetical protein ESB13_08070 [Filimonas effusa]
MIIRQYLFILIAAVFLHSCAKDLEFNDLSGTATLKGVIIMTDSLSGIHQYRTAGNITVFLKKAETENGYLYKVTADAKGQYSFNGIDPGASYTIYAATDTGSVKYSGELTYKANGFKDGESDSLLLRPYAVNQNGILLMVRNEAGDRVGNTTAWVFNNLAAFQADSSAGKIFDMVSNIYGVSNKINIAPGKYYLRVMTKLGSVNVRGEQEVVVDQTGIKPVVLTLQPYTINRTGVELTITDINAAPINAAVTYVYRSGVIADLDSTYANSLYSITSNNAGIAAKYDISPGAYFLRTIKVVGKDTLRSKDQVNVTLNVVTPKGIVLQR